MVTKFAEYLEELDTEWPTLFVILATTVYMFIESYEFPNSSSTFPRLTGTIVIIMGSIVVFSKIFDFELPGSTGIGAAEGPEEIQEEKTRENSSQHPNIINYQEEVRNLVILSGLIVIEVLLVLFTGLIFSSFVFVLLYAAVWKRMKWYETLLLLIATAALAWVFQSQLNIDMNQTYFETGFDFGQYWDLVPTMIEAQVELSSLIINSIIGTI